MVLQEPTVAAAYAAGHSGNRLQPTLHDRSSAGRQNLFHGSRPLLQTTKRKTSARARCSTATATRTGGGKVLGFQLADGGAGHRGVPTLAKLFDHLAIERGDVVGLPAGDETVIYHHFLVDPIATGVSDVSLNRRP